MFANLFSGSVLLVAWAATSVAFAASFQLEPRPGEAMSLSLEQVVEMALTNNVGLRIDGLTAEIRRSEYLGTWGAFDPVVSFAGTYSDSKQPPSNSFEGVSVVESESLSVSGGLLLPLESGGFVDWSYTQQHQVTNSGFALSGSQDTSRLSVSLQQPLLRGAWSGYATLDRQRSELRWRQAQAHSTELSADLRQAVTQAYWQLLASREALAVQHEAVALAERHREQNKRRLEVGLGVAVEVLQAEANVALQREALLQAKTGVLGAEDALKVLIFSRGTDTAWAHWLSWWDQPIRPTTALPEIEERPLDWGASFRSALGLRAELRQRRIVIELSELEVARAQSEGLPDLSLTLSLSSNALKESVGGALESAGQFEHPTASATVSYSSPLLNRASENAMNSARLGLRAARLAHEQAELEVLIEVRQAVRNVEERVAAVLAASLSLSLTSQQLEAEQARFSQGLSTNFQVLEYQQQLSRARSNLVAARGAYASAQTDLLHAEGCLLAPRPHLLSE